jgi:Zn finger protein HypA/HybF involved in hydrogenase expression
MLPKNIPHSVKCPRCVPSGLNWDENLARLEWQKDTWGFDYLVYYCENCKEGFTTTKSDELSIKTRQIKKRNLIRKNKIKKLNNV